MYLPCAQSPSLAMCDGKLIKYRVHVYVITSSIEYRKNIAAVANFRAKKLRIDHCWLKGVKRAWWAIANVTARVFLQHNEKLTIFAWMNFTEKADVTTQSSSRPLLTVMPLSAPGTVCILRLAAIFAKRLANVCKFCVGYTFTELHAGCIPTVAAASLSSFSRGDCLVADLGCTELRILRQRISE